MKASKRAAQRAVRFAVFGAPVLAALAAFATPSRASNPALLSIDVGFSGIANILNLTASSGTAPGTIDLTWTEPVRNAGTAPFVYEVKVSSIAQIGNETAFSTSSVLSAVSPSLPPTPGAGGGAAGFVVTGLTPGVTYYFAIVEHDSPDAVTGSWIRNVALNENTTNFAYAAMGAPAAPASGAVLASSSNTATGDWTLSVGATDYVLTASTNAAVPPYPITASSTTASSTATLAGLAPNTTYYFAVSACDFGCSAFAAIGSTVTAAVPAITLSTTAVSSDTVSVSFNGQANPAGTSYLVELSLDGVNFSTSLSTQSLNATAGGLSGGATYYVEVVAVNSAGTPAAPSNVVKFVTLPGTPGAPTGGAPLAVYSSSASVDWNLSGNATDYILVASTNSTVPPYPITASSTTAASTATLTGLGPNTTYYFFVAACGTGCSNFALAGSTITAAAPALTLTSTSLSSTTASLAFNADGNPAGTNFEVEISTDGVDFSLELSTQSANTTASGLLSDTTYYFEVVAVNSVGTPAAPSNILKVVTPLGVPAAPTGGGPSVVYTSSATANWTMSQGATDYVLVASTNSTVPPYPITASSTTVMSTATLTGLAPNTTYYFFTSACAAGCSPYAVIGSTVTGAAPALTLAATAVSSNTASVAFNADGNPAGTNFLVELSLDDVNFSTSLSTQSPNASLSGLSASTTYYVEVVAVNSAGTPAAPSNVVKIVTLPGTPSAPTGGTPLAVYASSASVDWNLSANATDYVLVASTNSTVPPYPITASSTTAASTATLTGLGPNTTYYFFVAACGTGCSNFALAGSTITAAAPALTLTSTSLSSTTASLAFNADGNPAGTNFEVEISTDGVDFSLELSTQSANTTASGLLSDTTYYFEVVAVNSVGTPAAPSNILKVVTPLGVPAAPTGGGPSVVYTSSATANWTMSQGATDYVLVASTNSTVPPYPIAASSTTVMSTATLTGLAPNTTYYFFTSACAAGCSPYAVIGSTITGAAPAITLSTTSVSSTTVSVAFNADGNPAGTNFLVELSLDDVNFSTSLSTQSPNASLSGLSASTTYYVEVVAVNSAGTPAAPSNVVKIVTLPGTPSAPTGGTPLAVYASSASVDWNLSANATDYVLVASTNSTVPPYPITASSTTAASTATLTGLGPNTTYYFFVAACGTGCSNFALAGSTITAAAPALTLTSTSLSSTTASLAFNADGNPAGTNFEVEISTDGVDFSLELSTQSANTTASGLLSDTTYYFEVVAVNSVGTPAAPSNILKVVTPLGVPAAPTGGGPSVVYTSSATANWTMSQGATDYVLVASTNSTVPPYPITASSTTVMSTATLTGLAPNTTYYFFTSACAAGCSPYAVIGSTITGAAPAITLSTTSVSSTTVSVAFGADGNPAGTSYLVELSLNGVSFTTSLSTQSLNATAVGLSGNTTYYAEVVAVNGAGVPSAPSNVVKFVTPSGVPAAPAGGGPGTVYTSSATANWALSGGATDYVLIASTSPANPPTAIAASSTTAASTGTLTGLGPNTTYYFFVSACDYGCSPYTAIGSTITAAAPALTLTSTAVSSAAVSVAFSADGNPAGTKYLVEVSTDGVDFTTALSTLSVNATASGLSPNTTYYFEVVAVNGAGIPTVPSNILQIVTPLGVPAAPTGGGPSVVYTSSATANWAMSQGATDYVLVASTNSTVPPYPITASSTTVMSTATLTGLGPNTTYYFFVSACGSGCSPYAVVGSTLTDAAPAITLSTTAVSSNTVSVAFGADGNPSGTKYLVELSTDGVDFTASLSTQALNATAIGLGGDTTYYAEVVAVNGAGVLSVPSNVVKFTTLPGTPTAPTGGAPVAVSSSSATVGWNLSANATDYVLVASTNSALPPYPITASSTTLGNVGTVTGLGPNTTYYFFVAACGTGCSNFALAGSTLTAAAPALTLTSTAVSSSTVSLAWNADGNPAGTKYLVEVSTDGVDFTTALSTLSVNATATGLNANATYYFEVVAVNGAGVKAAPSNVLQVLTALGAPAAPTGGAPGTVYTSSATVNWGLSAGATDYVLVASQSPNNPPTSIVATTTTLTSPGTLTGLGPNTTYYFFVTACAGGCSSYDAAGSTITAAAPAIALTTTSVSTSTVSLAWNADGNPAGTKYVVEESTDGVDFAAALSTASVDATTSGLNGNTTYYFEIVAVNGAGTPTSPSNVVQILTPPGPPAPPTGGAVIATSSVTATAAWTVSTGATDYVLIASTGAANPTAAIAGSSTTLSNAATIAGLSPNTTYYLFTSACGVGCSSFASDGSTITLATPAVGLSTSSVFANFVSLTWGSGGNPAGTTYQILESLNGVNYTLAATATGTSGSVSGLTHNTTYFFEVVAVNFAGTPTAPSAPVQVVTPLVATLPEVPMEPLGVTVSAGPNSVRLGWSPTTRYTGGVPFASTGTPVAGELEGYAIYRSTEICGPNFVQVSTVGLSAAPTYTDATGGVSYYYRLFSYNTVGLSTGVVTVSPLGERYFFTDDCVTNLAVDPQTAVAINGLVGTSNGLGGDVRIVRTRRPQDNGSNILESAQWYAYLNGVTLLSSYALPTPGHYTLHVTTQAGNAVPDLNPINTASPFGGIVVTPISGAASVTPIDDLGAVWYNGQQFVNLYGKIDTVDDNVDFDSPNLGLFQIRAQARSSSGPVFDATNISSKIITPDSPGHTAVWIFSYDPGPNNVIPSGRVYDLHGEHIADLQPGLVPNTLTWDGRMNGRTVSSGVYIYHISGGGKTFSGTIVVAK